MSKAKADQLTKEIKALKDQIKQAKADKHDVNDGGMFSDLVLFAQVFPNIYKAKA